MRSLLLCLALLCTLLPLSSARGQENPSASPRLENTGSAPVAAAIVASVQFVNAVYFRETTLQAMVAQKVGAPLDQGQVQQDARTIATQYRKRGFFSAKVNAKLRWYQGQAQVYFYIDAGQRAVLRHLQVTGNHDVDDQALLQDLFSKPDQIFGVFKQAGVFHAKRLDGDLQQVNRNYYQRGYLQAQATGWKAYASPDGSWVDVEIFVTEGPQYHLGEAHFYGSLPASEAKVLRSFAMRRGDVANMNQVSAGLESVLDLWRDRGYPYVRAQQFPSVLADKRLLNLVFKIEPGTQATVNEIRISGEHWTADHVIEREYAFAKGEVYSLAKLRKTQQKLMATGLFTAVTVIPVASSSPDLVDVELSLTERPGIIKDCAFSIAPAYLQYEGWIGIGLLMCPNFMGQGQRFSAIGQLSALRQLYDISLVEPRLLGSRLQLSGGVHRRSLVYPVFTTNALGTELGLNTPLPAGVNASVTYLYDRITVTALFGPQALAGSLRFPHDQGRSVLRLGLSHASKRMAGEHEQSSGHSLSLSIATAGAWTFSDIALVELRVRGAYYQPLPLQSKLKLRMDLATIANPTGQPVPVSERYFVGGYGSVRGYSPRSLGPTQRFGDASDPSGSSRLLPLGGVSQAVFNAELELPLLPSLGVKGFLFFDAGNAFGEDESFFLWNQWDSARELPLPLGLYASTGFGLLIPTGTLPLRLEWSLPLTRRPGDKQLDFFFGIGGIF